MCAERLWKSAHHPSVVVRTAAYEALTRFCEAKPDNALGVVLLNRTVVPRPLLSILAEKDDSAFRAGVALVSQIVNTEAVQFRSAVRGRADVVSVTPARRSANVHLPVLQREYSSATVASAREATAGALLAAYEPQVEPSDDPVVGKRGLVVAYSGYLRTFKVRFGAVGVCSSDISQVLLEDVAFHTWSSMLAAISAWRGFMARLVASASAASSEQGLVASVGLVN